MTAKKGDALQIKVRNQFLAFNFPLAGKSTGLETNGGSEFSVKVLKQRVANIMTRGMECIVIKNQKAVLQGTITEVKPMKNLLFLKCSTSGKE